MSRELQRAGIPRYESINSQSQQFLNPYQQEDLGTLMLKIIAETYTKFISDIATVVVPIIQGALSTLLGIGAEAAEGFEDFWHKIVDFDPTAITDLINGVKTNLDNLYSILNGVVHIIFGPDANIPMLGDFLKGIKTVLDGVSQTVTDVMNFFKTGQLPAGLTGPINPLALPSLDLLTGLLKPLQIPNLDASKIVSGVFNAVMIPVLDASKIVSGVFNNVVIPPLQGLLGLLTGQQVQNNTITQDKVATRDPSNLVWNGDFEDGLNSWQWATFSSTGVVQVVSNRSFQGASSLYLKSDMTDTSAGAAAWTGDGIACAGGDKFTMTVRVFATADYWGGPQPQFYTTADGWQYFDPDSTTPQPPITLNQWNTYILQTTAPVGAERIRVSMWAYQKCEIWYDRVEFRRTYATASDLAIVGQTTADLSKAVVTLANATYAQAAYLAPFSRNYGNAFEDATFDRGDLKYQPFTIDYTTGPGSSHYHTVNADSQGTVNTSPEQSHTHQITAASTKSLPIFTPTLGRLYILPISCERDRVYSQVILQTTGSSMPTRFYLAVGQINRTTGDITKVYDFGDVRGSLVSATGKLVDQLFNTTTNISASAGSVNCLMILQTGGTARQLAAVSDTAEQSSSVPLYPKYLTGYSTATNLTSIPASVANSSLATAYNQQWTWGALSQPFANQVDADSTYLDDFNRSNTNSLGSVWTVSANNFQINTNAAQLISGFQVLGGRNTALYTKAFTSNNQSVEATIKNFSTSGVFGLILRRNPDATAWAQMVVKSNKVTFEIYRNGGYTEYNSANISNVQTGTKFRLSVSGTLFSGYLNNTLLWSVNDDGGLLGNGTQTRNWGFFMDYTALSSAIPSPIDSIIGSSTIT